MMKVRNQIGIKNPPVESTFSISEVFAILKQKKDLKKQVNFSKVFEDTLSYVTKFSKIKDVEQLNSLNSFIEKTSLSMEEKAQIINLCPKDSKEAKKLIPSLESKADIELDKIIDEINLLKAI